MSDATPDDVPKKRGRGGCPTKLTPQLQAAVCKLIRAGNFRGVVFGRCARTHKVTARSLNGWIARGKRATSGPYYEFFHSILEAEADAEITQVGRVVKAAAKDARHAEWYLERKFPERWASNRREIRDLQQKFAALLKAIEDGKVGVVGAPGADGRPVTPKVGGDARPDAV